MNASDVAAWWGAGIATIVLVWDIVKWLRTGPKISVSVSPNMSHIEDGKLSNNKNVVVEAINTGDRLVTLTHLVTFQYKTKLHAFFGKRLEQIGIIPDPGTAQRLPFELAPGQRWVGLIDQEDMKTKSLPGLTYCGVIYSGRKEPVLVKLNIK